MNIKFGTVATATAMAAAMTAGMGMCTAASAQTAGSWSVRAGVTNIDPKVTSDNLTAPSLPGTKANVSADTQLSGGVTWMATDHIAIDVPLSLPFTHTLTGDGAILGTGKIGEVKALPITALVQYRFGEANAQFRPYLGAGPTYAKFYKGRSTSTLTALTGGTPATPTTLSVESKLAMTVQAGAVFAINERWFVDGMIAKTFLKTRTTLSTGQTLDTKLDPLTVSLSVGYRF
jgi:outer membrane protein